MKNMGRVIFYVGLLTVVLFSIGIAFEIGGVGRQGGIFKIRNLAGKEVDSFMMPDRLPGVLDWRVQTGDPEGNPPVGFIRTWCIASGCKAKDSNGKAVSFKDVLIGK